MTSKSRIIRLRVSETATPAVQISRVGLNHFVIMLEQDFVSRHDTDGSHDEIEWELDRAIQTVLFISMGFSRSYAPEAARIHISRQVSWTESIQNHRDARSYWPAGVRFSQAYLAGDFDQRVQAAAQIAEAENSLLLRPILEACLRRPCSWAIPSRRNRVFWI